MKQEIPPAAPSLTLQNKLDRIAHDRDVLALLRELAREGLREGDLLRHAGSGITGRLAVERDEQPPRPVVVCAGGTREPYCSGDWLRL
jgi:hypothetical protein